MESVTSSKEKEYRFLIKEEVMTAGKQTLYNLRLFLDTEFLEYPLTSTGTKVDRKSIQKI